MMRTTSLVLALGFVGAAFAQGYGQPPGGMDRGYSTGEGVDTGAMFDRFGKPTEYADHFTDENGLPRLVEGAPYVFPNRMLNEGQVGCVTVQFLISATGQTDKFVVVDSRPKGLFDEAVLNSLKFWKFDVKEDSGWKTAPVRFRFEAQTGTRVGRPAPLCAKPAIKVTYGAPSKVTHVVDPAYPPTLAQSNTTGCAVIGFAVVNGQADEYEIIDVVPDNNKDLVQVSLQALNRWRFEAGANPKQRGYAQFKFGLEGVGDPARACKVPKA